jgi:hypothetical protein
LALWFEHCFGPPHVFRSAEQLTRRLTTLETIHFIWKSVPRTTPNVVIKKQWARGITSLSLDGVPFYYGEMQALLEQHGPVLSHMRHLSISIVALTPNHIRSLFHMAPGLESLSVNFRVFENSSSEEATYSRWFQYQDNWEEIEAFDSRMVRWLASFLLYLTYAIQEDMKKQTATLAEESDQLNWNLKVLDLVPICAGPEYFFTSKPIIASFKRFIPSLQHVYIKPKEVQGPPFWWEDHTPSKARVGFTGRKDTWFDLLNSNKLG